MLCLAIPFAAMIFMIASNEMNFVNNKEYRVEVVGYDPVNILTGHYLTFRYQWPKDTKNSCTPNDECFACFKNETIELVDTTNLEACDASLLLDGGQPSITLTKYSISEMEAPVLDQMLRERNGKFEVGLLVYPDHTGQIKNLYINDEKLSDFFK